MAAYASSPSPGARRETARPPARQATSRAAVPNQAAPAAAGPAAVLHLQRQAGNQAVANLVSDTEAVHDTAPAEPFMIGIFEIGTYGDAANLLRFFTAQLEADATRLTEGQVPVPPMVTARIEEGRTFAELLAGGAQERIDRGNAADLRAWVQDFTRARNEARAVEAELVTWRAAEPLRGIRGVAANLDAMEPKLRDLQRAKFRDGDRSELTTVAQALHGMADALLATELAGQQLRTVQTTMSQLAATLRRADEVMNIASQTQLVFDVVSRLNQLYTVYQAAFVVPYTLLSGARSEAAHLRQGIGAIATGAGAVGGLIGASASFAAYANLYLGPMTNATLHLLSRVEDLRSRTHNRGMIALENPDGVNWALEPGGREMFEWVVPVMHARSITEVPVPGENVLKYLGKYRKDLKAGTSARDEVPTTGWLMWATADPQRIQEWAYNNRRDLWGMLYGSMAVPSRTSRR